VLMLTTWLGITQRQGPRKETGNQPDFRRKLPPEALIQSERITKPRIDN